MTTVKIKTAGPDGFQTVRARKLGVPGLVITGSRGLYDLTHVESGCRMPASVYNYNATLEQIRNAAFLASGVSPVDWTVPNAELDRVECVAWYRAFGSALAHSYDGFR